MLPLIKKKGKKNGLNLIGKWSPAAMFTGRQSSVALPYVLTSIRAQRRSTLFP